MATKITTRVLADNAVTDEKIADVTLTTATQSASDNTTKVATTAYVTTAIANLADSAPSTLNTLNELAAALGDDANFSTTVTNSIATKLPLAGGSMTGALNITLADNNPQLTLISTDADANTGPILKLYRNSASPADNDALGRIQWSGEDDAGNDSTFARIDVVATDVSNGSEDARMEFSPAVSDGFTPTMSLTGGKVGIGTTSPSDPLVVESSGSIGGGATNANSYFTVTDGTYGLYHDPNEIFSDINGTFHIGANHANGSLRFHTGGTDSRMNIDSSGNVGIGTDNASSGLHLTGGSNTAAKLTLTNTAPSPDNTWSLHPIYNGQDLLLNEDSDTRVTFKSGGDLFVGGTTDRGRKFCVEGTGDLMALYSTNTGAGGAQLDLIHDSTSYADGDSVGIVNFATDDRQLASIKGVGAVSGERGVFHIGVRKSSSEYNHNAMRLHNGGDEVLLDIYSPSGSNRGAGYFRFKTDGASTEESVAQIYMEQGSGDGGSRKSNMYFQVADNGSPTTAMTIENNKYVSTATYLNVGTSSTASMAKLNVAGGIRFTHSPASAAGLNVVGQYSFNNSNTGNACGSVYYKMFILNFYHNNGHSQALFLANGGGGVGYSFTSINAGDDTIRNGIQDFYLTTIGSAPNTFRIQISNGGGALTVTRTSGSNSFQVSVQALTGG